MAKETKENKESNSTVEPNDDAVSVFDSLFDSEEDKDKKTKPKSEIVKLEKDKEKPVERKSKNALIPFGKNNQIEIINGYYDGKLPYQEAVAAAEKKEKEFEQKDRTIAYSILLVIFMALMIFMPNISEYVQDVNKDVTSNIETMPYIIGLNVSEAMTLLNGYEVEIKDVPPDDYFYEDGLVIKSNVDYMTPMVPDQKVILYVCKNPDAPATTLEKVVFPKFPLYKHNLVIQSATLKEGIITVEIFNQGQLFRDLTLIVNQFDKQNNPLNNRTFYFQNLKVRQGETFKIDIRLTNPDLYRIDFLDAQVS